MIWLLLLAGLALIGVALRLRRATGLPWARVVSSDTSGWRKAEAPLVSQRYGLVGRPDYLIETRAGTIPVEVKPGRTATFPYDSDLLQLAAYCLLVEDTTGRAPQYGLLRYAHQTFRMPFTAAVRADLLATLEDMRADRDSDDVARSHDQRVRCAACGFRDTCEDSLA